MSSPYQQSQMPPQYEPPQKSGCGCGLPILLGCLGMAVLCVILCAGGSWYVAKNADKWAVGIGRDVIVASINSSEIPAQEKTEVITQIDRVANAYKAGQINLQDLQRIMEQLQESPIFAMITVWGADKLYLEPSGLPEEEKQAGRRAFERALRGVYEKKITQEQLAAIVPQQTGNQNRADVKVTVENGKTTMTKVESPPEKLTDEQVRQMIAGFKKLADDAEIPDEPFQIDISDEVKKLVDQALVPQGK